MEGLPPGSAPAPWSPPSDAPCEQVDVVDAAADHQHRRSGAADLVMQSRTGYVESGVITEVMVAVGSLACTPVRTRGAQTENHRSNRASRWSHHVRTIDRSDVSAVLGAERERESFAT